MKGPNLNQKLSDELNGDLVAPIVKLFPYKQKLFTLIETLLVKPDSLVLITNLK